MASVYSVSEKLHKVRVKLYPNYLPGGEGTYIARTDSEATVDIKDIIAFMIKRGGYHGSPDEAFETITHFLKEMGYQIADGFAVDLGFFTLRVNVGGTFRSDKEPYDPEKHPIAFLFQALSPMLNLRDDIEVIVEGYADAHAWISEYTDLEEKSVNALFRPGNMFSIVGHKIKIAGGDPSCGVYLVPVDDPSKAVKIRRVGENTASHVSGIAESTGFKRNRVEIRTQYEGSSTKFLKTPRIITGGFVLEEA